MFQGIYTREQELNQTLKKKKAPQLLLIILKIWKNTPSDVRLALFFKDLKLALNSLFWEPIVSVHGFFHSSPRWID